MIYLDTSAFLKLYVRESGSALVQKLVTAQNEPLPLWDLLQAEMINAIRLKTFWGEIDGTQAGSLIALFDERLQRGQYFVAEIDRSRLMRAFRDLSDKTARTGCRTMVILHVACALQLGPNHFVSFDERQRSLASAAGLKVLPEDI